jgi:hypothetical protein
MAGMKDYAGLSSVDKAQFVALHMALLLDAQNAFYQWQEGWLSPELWHAWDFPQGESLGQSGHLSARNRISRCRCALDDSQSA